jgi:hypothetical protein
LDSIIAYALLAGDFIDSIDPHQTLWLSQRGSEALRLEVKMRPA